MISQPPSPAVWPALPILAVGLACGAALPAPEQAGWWLGISAVVGAVLMVPGLGWGRYAILVLAALCLGRGIATPPVETPQLIASTATVHRVYPRQFGQTMMLTGVTAAALPARVMARAERLPGVRPGDRVAVRGLLTREAWGERWVPVIQVNELTLIEPREQSARARAWAATEHLPRHQELAQALLLGRAAPPERAAFHRSGLLHLLAVSGLHLGLALAGLWLVLRGFGVPWWPQVVVLAGGVLGYLWFTGAAVPTQRAAVMALAFLAGGVCARRLHRLAAVSLATVILIFLDPGAVRGPGMQLTVVAVAGITTLGQDFITLRRRWCPLQPWPLDRPVWRALLATTRWSLDALAIGIAASMAVLPVLAWHFGEAQSWSALASVVATPLLMVVLAAGLLWLVVTSLWPSGPWAGLLTLVEHGLASLSAWAEWVGTLPAALVSMNKPQLWWLVLWAGLFVPLRDRTDLALRTLAAVLLVVWLAF